MKIRIDNNELQKTLKSLDRITRTNILEQKFLIKAADVLTIHSKGLYSYCIAALPCVIIEEGQVVVDSSFTTAGRLKGEVELEDDINSITYRSQWGNVSIPLPAQLFAEEEISPSEWDSSELHKLSSLTYILKDLDNGFIWLDNDIAVCMDEEGVRATVTALPEPMKMVLKASFVANLDGRFSVTRNSVVGESGNIVYREPSISKDYPVDAIELFRNLEASSTATVDPKELNNILSVCMDLSGTPLDSLVSIESGDNKLKLQPLGTLSHGVLEIDAITEGHFLCRVYANQLRETKASVIGYNADYDMIIIEDEIKHIINGVG